MNLKNSLKLKSQMLRVKGMIVLSFLAFLCEKIILHSWRFIHWTLLFCALWLFEIPSKIGFHSDIIALIIFIGGCFYLSIKDLRQFKLPHKNEVLQRLEHGSNLSHQPLRLKSDTPISSSSEDTLWQREHKRKEDKLKSLKLSVLQTNLAAYDRYGIRLLILLAFISGVWVSGPNTSHRIAQGLIPFTHIDMKHSNTRITMIITPPDYTGREQMVVQGKIDETLLIPEGSTLKLALNKRWNLPFSKPTLKIGEESFPFIKRDQNSYTLETTIQPGEILTLREDFIWTTNWSYKYIPDSPPEIKISGPFEILDKGQFQIPLELTDDYGVRSVSLRLENALTASLPPFIQPAEEIQLVMSPAGKVFETSPVFSFAWHGLAGQQVKMVVTALDAKGQHSKSESFEMVLPERNFRTPLARALISIRKSLIATPLQNYKDYALQINSFMNLSMERSVFMGMRSAASRLYHNEPSNDIAASVIALLWELAIHIEDGSFGIAEKNLQNIQQRLELALQDPNIVPEQIAALMQEMREAMMLYLQEAAQAWQEQAEQGQPTPEIPPEMLGEMMDMSDLTQMMDKLEAALMSGDKNAAQEIMAQLQRLMQMASPTGGELPQDIQNMIKAGEHLKEIIDEQEKLLAETRNQAELFSMLNEMGMLNGRDPATFNKTPEMSAAQNKIQHDLQELIDLASGAFSSPPDKLTSALEQMAQSQSQLSQGLPSGAIPAQEEALRILKESQQQMQSEMTSRLKQMTGISFSGAQPRYDPLGRPYGGQNGQNPESGSDVKVPDEAEIRRVQEIVDEIRRRASERERPHEELDYFRRLLRRF